MTKKHTPTFIQPASNINTHRNSAAELSCLIRKRSNYRCKMSWQWKKDTHVSVLLRAQSGKEYSGIDDSSLHNCVAPISTIKRVFSSAAKKISVLLNTVWYDSHRCSMVNAKGYACSVFYHSHTTITAWKHYKFFCVRTFRMFFFRI